MTGDGQVWVGYGAADPGAPWCGNCGRARAQEGAADGRH